MTKPVSIFNLMSDYEDSEIEIGEHEYVSVGRVRELVKRKIEIEEQPIMETE